MIHGCRINRSVSIISGKRIFIVVVIIFFLISSGTAGVLKGIVVDDRSQPLDGVNLLLQGTILGTATDVDGRFIIEKIPSGEFTLVVTRVGFAEKKIPISIRSDDTLDIGQIVLTPSPVSGKPVIVTASKYEQSLQESPVSVATLSPRELTLRNVITLDQGLQYLPGINLNGSQINIRGSSGYSRGVGSRVLVLLDGVPLMTGDTREFNFESIPIYLIDHVEVLKTAGSSLYGSSALGGVINILSPEISLTPLNAFKLYGGFYSEPKYETWQWTKRTRFLNGMAFRHERAIGSARLLIGASRDDDDSYRQNDWRKRYSAGGKLQIDVNPFQQFSLTGNYMHQKRGNFLYWQDLQHALVPPADQADDRVESRRYFLNGQYRWILSPRRILTFRTGWYGTRFEDNVSESIGGNRSTAGSLESEIQYNHQIGNHFLTGGVTLAFQQVKSNIFGRRKGYSGAGYLEDEIRIRPAVHLTVGARLDYFDIDELGTDYRLNPRLALVVRPSASTSWRTSVSSGFRAPSMAEAFTSTSAGGIPVIPNPDLQPERNISWEAGWNQLWNSWISTDVALFYNRFWDLIEGTFTPQGKVQFQNITDARIAGLETTISANLSRRLPLQLGYTYVDPQNLTTGDFLNYRPRHLLYSSIQFLVSNFVLGVDFRYLSRYDRIDENFAAIVPDAEKRVDIKVIDLHLQANFRLGNRPASASLQVNNLLQYYYVDLIGSLGPLRHYVLTFQAQL